MVTFLVSNLAWTISPAAKDNAIDIFVSAFCISLVFGFAVLILWLRDRSRDRRGVPDWIKEREQIKARRVGLSYRILVLACVGIWSSIHAFRGAANIVFLLMLLIAAIAFWLVWGDLKIFRGLNQRVAELNRQNRPTNDSK
jgi:hypothetical protein